MKPSEIKIGLARLDELNDVWELYKRTYLDAYTDDEAGITKEKLMDFLAGGSSYLPKYWRAYLETPSQKRTVYVARNKGKVVGMVAPILVDGKRRVTALYVAPELQGMGIGTKLMGVALAHHGDVDVYAGVASHVKRLPRFYEHLGFKVLNAGELKEYPADPMSYVEMMRPKTTG